MRCYPMAAFLIMLPLAVVSGLSRDWVNLASTVLLRYGLQGGSRYLPSGPSIGQLSNATSAAIPEGGTTKCMLISGPFSDFVQLSLAVMALSKSDCLCHRMSVLAICPRTHD